MNVALNPGNFQQCGGTQDGVRFSYGTHTFSAHTCLADTAKDSLYHGENTIINHSPATGNAAPFYGTLNHAEVAQYYYTEIVAQTAPLTHREPVFHFGGEQHGINLHPAPQPNPASTTPSPADTLGPAPLPTFGLHTGSREYLNYCTTLQR